MNKFLIAVVDDEVDITQLLANILSDSYDVIEFNTPKSYLEYLASETNKKPDLLICDYDMPQMNGLAMVKSSQEKGALVPFILLSGFLTKDNVLEALQYGVFSVLEKPIGVPILLRNIESLIKEHQLFSTHQDIRKIVKQLQEAYGHLSLMLEQYVPSDVLDRMVVEVDPETGTPQKIKFTALVQNLEQHLNDHFAQQMKLEEAKRHRSI